MTAGIERQKANGRPVRGRSPAGHPRAGTTREFGFDGRGAAPAGVRPRLRVGQWVRLALMALAIICLGAVAGWGTSALLPPRYAAHAQILYTITREQPTGFLREDRSITTQTVLLDGRTVLGPVAQQWHVPVDDLVKALTASVVSGSEVIDVTLTDASPDRARNILASVLTRYLAVSNDQARSSLRAYLDQQLATIGGRISQARAAGAAGAGELPSLVTREQFLLTQLDDLQFTEIAGPPAEVIVSSYAESKPVSPKPLLTAAAGGLAGVIVAAFAVAVLARRMYRH